MNGGPPRWSSGQQIWLLIMRSRVRSPALPQILNVDKVWNEVHPASWGQLVSYLIDKQRIWIRNATLLDLTERNVNHIIPSYCHLPSRSLVDRCGSFWPSQWFFSIFPTNSRSLPFRPFGAASHRFIYYHNGAITFIIHSVIFYNIYNYAYLIGIFFSSGQLLKLNIK